MAWDAYLAFSTATIIVLAIPGPTIMLVIGYALSGGGRTAWRTVPGVALGDALAMTLSLLGMGALIAASAAMFTVLKLCGAAYLVYLGIKLWRAPALPLRQNHNQFQNGHKLFWNAFGVTATNPKSIAFFVAFVPQFMDSSQAMLPQSLIMISTFVVLATINAAVYAYVAGTARRALTRPRVIKAFNRTGGSLLIGAGLLTAFLRRA